MKRQAVDKAFTQKVAEFLNQGYIIHTNTMGGYQGEIAHVDLARGSEILRVLLTRDCCCRDQDELYWGETIQLTVSRISPDALDELSEPIFQTAWADIGRLCGRDWFTGIEEGRRSWEKHMQRYRRRYERVTSTDLGEAYKSPALRWLRKQPGMEACALSDIENVRRIQWPGEKAFFEIEAQGRTFRITG
ncbi:MAG: hypothetical protein IKP40_09970 [Clostridia bacterium]|nr:hypothetical protein [Clostridia bacterium]